MGLFGNLVSWSLPLVPKSLAHRVARRYVAGDTLDSALETVASLNAAGLAATVALLGEEITECQKADAAVVEYIRLLDLLRERDLDGNASIKLTLLGLKIDEGFCRDNLVRVAEAAQRAQRFVRIDMEDHTCVDATLRLYHEVQARTGNLGIVLQSYLRRTPGDITGLRNGAVQSEPSAGRPGAHNGLNVRLCKGIYVEPRTVAWTDYETVRLSFLGALERLLGGGAYVGIATHDEYLVSGAVAMIERLGLERDQYEFQMLLGVDSQLRGILHDEGHRVRVYVPYGPDWYAYSMRRLRENPQIAIYVLRAMFGG